MTRVSVVLITRNQAWNVTRLIESVIDQPLVKEVVLVDSASSDETIELARRYPIRILRLREDQRLSAAAGRHVGLSQCSAPLVLFLDGDTELHPDWLPPAVSLLMSEEDIAGVTGLHSQLPIDAVRSDPEPAPEGPVTAEEVKQTGGCVLLRRSVLEQVGSFNPHLYSDEEPDLAIRIRHAGYRLLRLRYPMLWEYTDPKDEWRTVVRRRRRRLYLGAGQNLRYHAGRETFGTYVRERGFGFAPLGALVGGVGAVAWSIATRSLRPAAVAGAAAAAVFFGDAVRRRSLQGALTSFVRRLAIAEGTVRGFMISTPEPNVYPAKYDVVQ